MLKFGRWGIALTILVFSMQVFAGLPDYRIVFDHKQFLAEGILQVLETDLDEDNSPEWVLAGKNYMGRELFIFWLTPGQGLQPAVKWQSSNLFEDRSILWTATGRFNHVGKVLLAATNTKFFFFKAKDGALQQINEWNHNFDPLSLTAGDLDGDGYDELVVTRIGDVTSQMYQCYIQLWKLNETSWQAVANSAILGNIRGVTTGDINGDGKIELLVEEGLRTDSGSIHTLTYSGGKFTEIAKNVNEVKGAVYGMKVKQFESGMRLMTASSRGKINFFGWNGSRLIKDPAELSLSSGLVDIDAGDLDRDGILELCVVGYPQRLVIMKR